MKVSILVPVWGVEKYIEKCARSLMEQTWADIEYVFVDDASPDRSMEVLRGVLAQYPDRAANVKLVRHGVNRGVAAARNTAMDHATGEWLLHFDSDDFLERDAVERMAALAAESGADIVASDQTYVYAGRTVVVPDTVGDGSGGDYAARLALRRAEVRTAGKLIRRSLFERHGIRFIEGLDFGDDYAVTPRVAYHARRVARVDAPLYNYVRYNAGSYTKNVTLRSAGNVVRAVEVLADFFAAVPDAARWAAVVERMRMINKIYLLKTGDRAARQLAAGLYPGLDPARFGLPPADRLVLWLADRGRWGLLGRCVGWGYAIKKALGVKK